MGSDILTSQQANFCSRSVMHLTVRKIFFYLCKWTSPQVPRTMSPFIFNTSRDGSALLSFLSPAKSLVISSTFFGLIVFFNKDKA